MTTLGHVLSSSVVPLPLQWTAIGVTTAGAIGVLRRRTAVRDLIAWTLFSIGASVCVVMVGIAMVQPPPPLYTLTLGVKHMTTSPVQVTACARKLDGSAATVLTGSNVLGVIVDGNQVASQQVTQFPIAMSPGDHTLRVELLTRDHREFAPPVFVDTSLTVTGVGTLGSWAACPA